MPIDKVRELQEKLYQTAKVDKTRRFHSLRDKLMRDDILQQAWNKVKANKGIGGIDGVSIEYIEEQGAQEFLNSIKEGVKTDTYRVSKVRRVYIPKPNGKKRALGIPIIKDRVLQSAVKILIEPIFEADFEEFSYGFRPNLSTKDAFREIYKWLNFGLENVIDADISAFFDTIPHDKLMKVVERRIADGYVLKMIRAWLRAGILEEDKIIYPKEGTPQGGVISPLLANIYLDQLDKAWKNSGMPERTGCDAKLVRYADDFVILTSKSADKPYQKLQQIMEDLGLQLNKEKTRIVNAKDGFDFLGFRFVRRYSKKRKKWITYSNPSPRAMNRVRERIRQRTDKSVIGYLKLEEVVKKLNLLLIGWSNYYKHTNARESFQKIQRYANQRLRKFLRRRKQKQGYGYKEMPDKYLYDAVGLVCIAGRIQYVRT